MSAGITPGPWQVAGVRHSGDLRLGRDVRLHAVGPDNDAVAMVFFDMKTGHGWKDAHLIAASPELLGVTKLLAGFAEAASTLDFNEDRNASWAAVVAAQARAAIAKAECRS